MSDAASKPPGARASEPECIDSRLEVRLCQALPLDRLRTRAPPALASAAAARDTGGAGGELHALPLPSDEPARKGAPVTSSATPGLA
mmetsp:Transcript_86032/g.228679  ORF Transcript_86032/g.228679 Transcript_86032/m.228679 type:complete len:87 (+) Transcript_86032:41-301(+)